MSHPDVPADLRARIETDPWAQALGIRFLELKKGYARLSLRLQPHMVNFQGYPRAGRWQRSCSYTRRSDTHGEGVT